MKQKNGIHRAEIRSESKLHVRKNIIVFTKFHESSVYYRGGEFSWKIQKVLWVDSYSHL